MSDSQGQYLPPHADDPQKFEVVHIATNHVGIKDLVKKERVVPLFLKAHEDWGNTLQRVAELETMVPLSCSDEVWDKFVIGVHAVLEQLGVEQPETVGELLARRRVSASSSSSARPPLPQPPVEQHEASPPVARQLFPQDEVAASPGPVVGSSVRAETGTETWNGKIAAISLENNAFKYKVKWEHDGSETDHDWSEVVTMIVKNAPD